jgi:hypothetical protein
MPRFMVVEVPYHMGLEDTGVGRGPARFLRAGADRALAEGSPGQPGCPTVLHVRKRDLTATGIDAIATRAWARSAASSPSARVSYGLMRTAISIHPRPA